QSDAGVDPDRARIARRTRGRTRQRRRRLPDQAVRVRRAGGENQGAGAASACASIADSQSRRAGIRHRQAARENRRAKSEPVAEGKDAARIADAKRRAGGDARHDRGDGLGLELQLAYQPDRSIRQSAAPEDRSARRSFADSHRARSRIHDARGMTAQVFVASRWPPMTIRLRLTIYWAAVLAAILLVAAIVVVKLFVRQQWRGVDAALL